MPTSRRNQRSRSAQDVGEAPATGLDGLYREVLRDVGALQAEPDWLDLKGTPGRIQRMLLDELLSSYQPGALRKLKKVMTTFPAPKGEDSALVTEVHIPFYSVCAHHMIPFFGVAHIGYIPSKRIIGLSKLPRIVDHFSSKLQVQERLVEEIADFVEGLLKPTAVLVFLEARHLCLEMRGVRKAGVVTRTPALRGLAVESERVRREFYDVLALPRASI